MKNISEAKNFMIVEYDKVVIFLPLGSEETLYTLEEVEAQIFKNLYKKPNPSESLAQFAEANDYDFESLIQFANKLLEKLTAMGLIQVTT